MAEKRGRISESPGRERNGYKFFKKKFEEVESSVRRALVDRYDENYSITRQCKLLVISKSTLYYEKRPMKETDRLILNRIDEIYTGCPFYGARKISKELYNRHGIKAGRKKVRSMMKMLGIEAICLKKKLSRPNKEHAKYPYLLKGLDITRRNMVWSADITYIRLAHGYAYLVAVIDWYSRYVLSWRISYSMDTSFCIAALNEALDNYGTPEYFNTDQGSQFTDKDFVGILERKEIKISMDGKGRALDNVFVERLWRSVKYEDVYLKKYATMFECETGLKKYFTFYNYSRIHQALDYKTPAEIYLPKTKERRKVA